MATYNHVSSSDTYTDDDERYIRLVFNKSSEQAWDDSGKPIKDKKVLSKKGAKKFAHEILATWKKFSQEETDSYIEQNFDNIWGNYCKEDKGGNIDLSQAAPFIKELA